MSEQTSPAGTDKYGRIVNTVIQESQKKLIATSRDHVASPLTKTNLSIFSEKARKIVGEYYNFTLIPG